MNMNENKAAMRLGTCPCSWGVWYAEDPRQVRWQRYLDEIVEAGYRLTELGPPGYLPGDPQRVQDELRSRGLEACAFAAAADMADPAALGLLKEKANICAPILSNFNDPYFVLMDSDELVDARKAADRAEIWKPCINTAVEFSGYCAEELGLTCVFHPHVGTMVQSLEEIERFLDDTANNGPDLCFDTGHHIYTGADPVDFIKRYSSRIAYYHLKNMDGEVRKFAAANNISDAEAFTMNVMCELERGVLDFRQIRDAIAESGFAGIMIIEQDIYPAPKDKALPLGKANLDYCRRIGLGV